MGRIPVRLNQLAYISTLMGFGGWTRTSGSQVSCVFGIQVLTECRPSGLVAIPHPLAVTI